MSGLLRTRPEDMTQKNKEDNTTKISEMNTERAFECMARMAPHAAELVSDPQLAKLKKRLLSQQSQVWDFMAEAYPLVLDKHREAMLSIAAALSGKTADEVREQPLGGTAALMREGFTGELFRFFAVCRAVGSQRVTWLLHRYRPFTVDALLELARHDAAERRVALYTADMTWLAARLNARGSRSASGRFEIQPPSEIARKAFDGAAHARDTRSGAQIVADLAARLREKA